MYSIMFMHNNMYHLTAGTTNYVIYYTANGMVCFEAVQHPGQHLGILPDGSLKAPTATGKGDHGRFHIILG